MERITRAAAVAAVAAESSPPCLICALVDRRARQIAETARSVAVLDRFPRQWGHALILLRRHATRFAEVDPADWADATALAARVAAAIERALEPARVFVASLGTARDDLAISSPHLHLHVVPVPDASLRPRDVFSWKRGVLAASGAEWRALQQQLLTALECRASV